MSFTLKKWVQIFCPLQLRVFVVHKMMLCFWCVHWPPLCNSISVNFPQDALLTKNTSGPKAIKTRHLSVL